ncbi:MAG: bifunctional nuclease family protein [Acidimicrobiales bacterium]
MLGLRPGSPEDVVTADKKFKRIVRDRARRTGERYAAARRQLLRSKSEVHVKQAPDSAQPGPDDLLVEMRVHEVTVSEAESVPMVVLQEVSGGRRLPIFIRHPEAMSIRIGLAGNRGARPMTHDALKLAVDSLGAAVTEIVIGFQPDINAFTADVAIKAANEDVRHLDWRPSDAIALALRTQPVPPIFVPETLLATPPPNIPGIRPGGLRLRCVCGAWMSAGNDVTLPMQSGPTIDVDVQCPDCGERRHVRLGSSPTMPSPPA